MMRSAFDSGERLGVGVGDDEVDTLKPGGDHVVDGVAAGAADTEHGHPRLQLADIGDLQVDAHGCLLLGRTYVGRRHVLPVCLRPIRKPETRVKRMVSIGSGSSEALPQPSSDPGDVASSLSSAAAFAAVRSVRGAPPADRPAGRSPRRRPGPWRIPAGPTMPSGRPMRTGRFEDAARQAPAIR